MSKIDGILDLESNSILYMVFSCIGVQLLAVSVFAFPLAPTPLQICKFRHGQNHISFLKKMSIVKIQLSDFHPKKKPENSYIAVIGLL